MRKIFVLRGDGYDPSWLNRKIRELTDLAPGRDAPGLGAELKAIIPQYQPFDPDPGTLLLDQHYFPAISPFPAYPPKVTVQ